MERLILLVVGRDGEVHILHSFFSNSGCNLLYRDLLALFQGRYSLGGLRRISEIPVASLAVRRSVSAVLREDRMVHI